MTQNSRYKIGIIIVLVFFLLLCVGVVVSCAMDYMAFGVFFIPMGIAMASTIIIAKMSLNSKKAITMALVNALLFVIFLQLLLATFWGLDKDPSARFWFQAWCIPTSLFFINITLSFRKIWWLGGVLIMGVLVPYSTYILAIERPKQSCLQAIQQRDRERVVRCIALYGRNAMVKVPAEACKNFPFGWRPQDTRNLCRKVSLAEYAAEGQDEQIKKLFIEPEKNTPSKE